VGIDPHQVPLQRRGLDYLRDVITARAVLLPSRVQLGLVDPDPRRAAQSLLDQLQKPVIARLDSEGMYVVTAQGSWSLVDQAVDVVETTGAGDSSAAAIVAALTLGHDFPTAAAFGMSVARWAIADWGHQGLIHREPLTRPLSTITITREA
jgi:sugar/nucleoside kinase (ribokinase family)